MKVRGIKDLVERKPFRPFGIRLNNGARYTFKEPRDFGAPRDCHFIIYFGADEALRIDAESITEIIER